MAVLPSTLILTLLSAQNQALNFISTHINSETAVCDIDADNVDVSDMGNDVDNDDSD